ncbi:MAG TPA: trypsin-like peptidase domain-containing protein [Marmoricola sp.]|nr:trypsin-like peptidase domain-containing protein [Marmoricola sp.]
MQNTRSPLRRWTSSAAALGLAVPLTVFAAAGPAGAAHLVDGGWGGGYAGYGYSAGPWGQTASTETTNLATAAESRGLVEITSVLDFGEAESAGTGMILGSDGIVVTNHHVVADATSIKVTDVSTGTTYAARVIGTDATRDVAVLRLVGASGLTPVTLDPAGTITGASVTAVGDAGGDGGALTAAPGTVSALDARVTVQDDAGGSSTLTGLIEIAADIIPGDSGGALYDADGEVVGMNVAASSGTADVTGYVIPAATVQQVAAEILAGQKSSDLTYGYSAFLGVELSGASTAPLVAGVLESGAADKAGITAADTITSVDGTAVTTIDGLKAAVASSHPGSKLRVTWTDQAGTAYSAEVTLGRAPVA